MYQNLRNRSILVGISGHIKCSKILDFCGPNVGFFTVSTVNIAKIQDHPRPSHIMGYVWLGGGEVAIGACSGLFRPIFPGQCPQHRPALCAGRAHKKSFFSPK